MIWRYDKRFPTKNVAKQKRLFVLRLYWTNHEKHSSHGETKQNRKTLETAHTCRTIFARKCKQEPCVKNAKTNLKYNWTKNMKWTTNSIIEGNVKNRCSKKYDMCFPAEIPIGASNTFFADVTSCNNQVVVAKGCLSPCLFCVTFYKTNASQSWNHGLPVRGPASSPTFQPMLPNLGTAGSQFKELTVPKPRKKCFPNVEPQVPSSRN